MLSRTLVAKAGCDPLDAFDYGFALDKPNDRMIRDSDVHPGNFASTGGRHEDMKVGSLNVARRGTIGRVLGLFAARRVGRGATGGSRNLCTICGMILTFLYKNVTGPLFHRQAYIVQGKEGRRLERRHVEGRPASRFCLLI